MQGQTSPLPSFELWTGCYTADSHGHGAGVGAVHVGAGVPAWSHLAVQTPSPSFIAKHPTLPVLYAVGEAAQTVTAFTIEDAGHLQPLGEAWAAGAAACHVAVDPRGRFLVVSCWGDGQVLCYRLGEDGSILSRTAAPAAVDPYAADGPRPTRAHCALMLNGGRIATTDLGFDLLRVWRYDAEAGLVPDHEAVFPKGSEPRHLVQHPSGRILVVGEVSVKVFVLAQDADGRFTLESSAPVLERGAADGDTASEISLDGAGRYLLVGVRGSNRIATLSVQEEGARIDAVSDVSCGGVTPRHHLQLGQLLLIANQDSDSITAFRLDAHSGEVIEQIAEVSVGSPSCLLPA